MMLHFRKEFVEDILKGKKTATIRLGERNVRPGNRIILASGGKPFAKAIVTKVKRKKVRELSITEIKKDGYKSFSEFFKELKKIYPEAERNSYVTYIEWRLLGK